MADKFTLTDRLQAMFASCTCLSCFSALSSDDSSPENAHADVDALSLHSSYAGSHHHLPRKTDRKISLFGWNLFGHGDNGLRLPDSDNEGEDTSLFGRHARKARQRRERNPAAESTSTLDSDADAAPLDLSSIDLRAAEDAGQRQKELEKAERRRLRRERKELKRLALTAPFQDNEEFEGFPGSGSNLQPSYFPAMPQLTPLPRPQQANEEADPDADLDGGMYFARSSAHISGSRSNSYSRSQTSVSRSTDGAQYSHHYQHSHLVSPELSPFASPQLPPTKKKRTKKSAQSSSSASASISLPSPAAADDHGFQPFIQGQDYLIPVDDVDYESKFPSIGFTGTPRLERTGSLRDQGGKLAHSGF